MEFKELMTGFASKLGIVGLDVDEERTFLEIDGMKVEVFQDEKANTMSFCFPMRLAMKLTGMYRTNATTIMSTSRMVDHATSNPMSCVT